VTASNWYLDGIDRNSGKTLRVVLNNLPFSVGRLASCDLTVHSQRISQVHAEFFNRDDMLWLRDHNSTNGTFINGHRIESEQKIEPGDVVHFADQEFRLDNNLSELTDSMLSATLGMTESRSLMSRHRALRDLLQAGAVTVLFQPIVTLHDQAVFAYEVLGRGTLDKVTLSTPALFFTAETAGLAPELSALFRRQGLAEARVLPQPTPLFVNSHPVELKDHAALLSSMEALRARYPNRPIILEIHESAVTEPATLKRLGEQLAQSFDDFGTGQARLLELADAAPQYIKFDVSLIRNLHRAKKRRGMVKTLVQMIHDLDIVPIAEGIEKSQEADVCAELGFEYGQGYYFGRPARLERVESSEV